MRDERIDFLRFLGLAMIILAHMDPPGVIFQLRNFDVPLMVIVSGLSFSASYKKEPYVLYFWNRAKRLVLPVWIFLSAYFLCMYLTKYPTVLPTIKIIASSYLLLNGIGYVWIIRVFLLVAMVAPFIYRFSRSQPSHYKYFTVVLIIYLAYELLVAVCLPLPKSPLSTVFESTIFYMVPYAAVFALGVRFPALSRYQIITVACVALFIFVFWLYFYWLASGKIITTQVFKYPPQSYYLSYAICVASLVWLASEKIVALLQKVTLLSLILFVGRNSIWIYLWHIPFIQLIKLPFLSKYILVFFIAATMTWIQTTLVNNYILPKIKNTSFKKNVRLSLTG